MDDYTQLIERVNAFRCFELPGQPMAMHMGTSYLVNDLAKALKALQARVTELTRLNEASVPMDTHIAALAERDAALAEIYELRAALSQPEPVSPPIVWPKAKDVGRYGDMSQSAHLRVGFDSDNDVCVSVWDDNSGASIEFCNPGGGGGGKSSHTRMALIALMVAMEADNAATPALDWWAVRSLAAAKGGAV